VKPKRSKLDPLTAPFTILVDGREQARYPFTGLRADAAQHNRSLIVPSRWAHLKTGDYTIEGLENLVAVERKSLADLYSTLGQHRDRFEREHERLACMAAAAVVIEADWETILFRPPERSRLLPKTVFRTALSWQSKYGVPWLAMGSRELAEIATFRFLELFYKHRLLAEKTREKESGGNHAIERNTSSGIVGIAGIVGNGRAEIAPAGAGTVADG
jgi:hypothetical protein